MQRLDGRLIFSATDLSNFLACRHLTLLSRRTALGGPRPRRFDDPGLEVLQQRGLEHEQAYLAHLRAGGAANIAHLSALRDEPYGLRRIERQAKATVDAMRAGADVVYQGCLFDGQWLGYPDFLRRVERPSELGAWSYEVVDAKLAREAKGGAVLQILLYADLLASVQGFPPAFVHLALGGPDAHPVEFRVKDYAAYFRAIRKRFLEWVAAPPGEMPVAPDPVPHCDLCDWEYQCDRERRAADHLCFVAGITRQQRKLLVEAGLPTLAALGDLDVARRPRIEGISPAALDRIHSQARIQLQGRKAGDLLHELLPVVPEQGLAALPEPSPGDLFLDLEGDPYALEHGIEYLFGVVDAAGNYEGRWSLDRATERRTFEWFMDLVTERLRRHPDLHIYHYAAYEPTALKRLAGQYDTRIDELDAMLRGKVFVDLYRVVRQGLRASVESYSIKKIEELYGFRRQVDLKQANRARADFEAWLELGGTADEGRVLFDTIRGYNQDDCDSTLRLREWLEQLREPDVPRPGAPSPEPTEEMTERLQAVRALMGRLMIGVPEARAERSAEHHGRWLLAQLLEYHRRENKSMWWRYFNWLDMSDEELIEDGSALGGLEFVDVVGEVKQSRIYRYRFPPQEYQLAPGTPSRDPRTEDAAGEIVAIDEAAGTIDLRRGKRSTAPHPRALIPYEYVKDDVLRDSLFRLGALVAERGFAGAASRQAAVDLILASVPRVGRQADASLVGPGEATLDAAIRLVAALDRSVLAIQGPPGSGKTYTGARMILAELARGKKVGITATSHKVISNLLKEICDAAGGTVHGMQKADEEDWCGLDRIERVGSNEEVLEALQSGAARLAAGTAWLWSREEMTGAVDVLFIDEAGQFSLANALAVAPAATNLVLLGDPRQLQQPQQGLHPPDTDVSALDHLLAGQTTMPSDRGLFLDKTWRLHPQICAFTSEVYYDDRLTAVPGLENQRVEGTGAVSGSGLRWIPVEHSGNQNESPEEAATIAALVTKLLATAPTWTTEDRQQRTLSLNDVLIVAPYNAQVAAIEQALPGARVGTVDKFQGQEAPIVIYSMASSSAEDAPRGMVFLYSPNRLNVATSRARCLVILVANGQVFFPECRTPEQMKLANGLCRYLEMTQSAVIR